MFTFKVVSWLDFFIQHHCVFVWSSCTMRTLYRNFLQKFRLTTLHIWWLIVYNEFLFVDNLPYKTSRPCYPGWRKAWKPESCHHFHARRRLTNNRYESGMLFLVSPNMIFVILRPDIIIQLRITTWKKLLKWEICSKNFLKGMIWDTHQFSAWGNISSLEGVPLYHN